MDKHETSGLASGVCFFIASAIVLGAGWPLLLTSCVSHEVRAPQLDTALDKLTSMPPPVKCRTLDLPPVPDRVKLDISGDKISADDGGETLLLGYVACRSLYRSQPVK